MNFLSNLPSKGRLTHLNKKSNKQVIQNPPKYICTHDTQPPSHQIIKNDDANMLIKSLNKRKTVPTNITKEKKPPPPEVSNNSNKRPLEAPKDSKESTTKKRKPN
eukprot:TRINITY_DN3771_c0_g1_i1.p1 TRINITY_DN3771_c0_g1~~TRINITY_DN3771_c0_g1_i1.p1  ORF type:complete len:105 (-),score=22.04 TRINITY_DN3771_c0_g1_i1:82-396(-)